MNEEDPLPQPGEERGADDTISQPLETDIDGYVKNISSRIIAEKITCQKPFIQNELMP